jgi:hypothetical protein
MVKLNDLKDKILELNKYIEKLKDIESFINNYLNDYKNIKYLNLNFYNIDHIQDQTNILCWWCCHEFDNIPFGLPEKYHDGIYYVMGCFCSLNCALAYNLDLNDDKVWERTALIYDIKNNIFKDDITINPSSSRYILIKFGGNTTIENYRKNNIFLDKKYKIMIPPTISLKIQVEEQKDKNNNYKLKRNKPLTNNKLNIINKY